MFVRKVAKGHCIQYKLKWGYRMTAKNIGDFHHTYTPVLIQDNNNGIKVFVNMFTFES